MDPVRLSGRGVTLRLPRETDIEAIVAQANDPESRRWTGVSVPYTRLDAQSEVNGVVPEGWRRGDWLLFAVADAVDDNYLGWITISHVAGGGEIGYGVAPWARGRGAAGTAVNLLVDWAFDPGGLDLRVIEWRALVGNWASRRVAWQAGFRIEGLVRGLLVQRGQRGDGWIGTLRRDDPREPTVPWLDAPSLPVGSAVLRRWRESDAEACVEARNDPAILHWLSGFAPTYTRDDAIAFIRSREEEHAGGRGIYWALSEGEDGVARGSFSLMGFNPRTATAEIGYWVHPALRERGVATAAVRAVTRHAFASPTAASGLGLRRIILRAAAGNVASQRVAEKSGFARGGIELMAERLGDGSFEDLVRFELLNPVVAHPRTGVGIALP